MFVYELYHFNKLVIFSNTKGPHIIIITHKTTRHLFFLHLSIYTNLYLVPLICLLFLHKFKLKPKPLQFQYILQAMCFFIDDVG